MNRPDWALRIERAAQLACTQANAAPALRFYTEILRTQHQIYRSLESAGRVGMVERCLPLLLNTVERYGTDELRSAAAALRAEGPEAWCALIEGVVDTDDSQRFLARCLLEASSEWLAVHQPREAAGPPANCPACGAPPQMALLRPDGEGSRRFLVCGMCKGEWPFSRITCPRCGETEFEKLPVFIVEQFGHFRVEACDTCRAYLLCIDMAKCPDAVPTVDELAAVAVNLSAQESGYEKLEPNLLGL